MEIIIFLGIPLIAVTIADLRARKGKTSKALLALVFVPLFFFNVIAILNAFGKENNKVVITGGIMIVAQLIMFFTAYYITEKQAKKYKNNSDNRSNM